MYSFGGTVEQRKPILESLLKNTGWPLSSLQVYKFYMSKMNVPFGGRETMGMCKAVIFPWFAPVISFLGLIQINLWERKPMMPVGKRPLGMARCWTYFTFLSETTNISMLWNYFSFFLMWAWICSYNSCPLNILIPSIFIAKSFRWSSTLVLLTSP